MRQSLHLPFSKLLRLSPSLFLAFLLAFVLFVPVWAAPSTSPTGGNVDANFHTVTATTSDDPGTSTYAVTGSRSGLGGGVLGTSDVGYGIYGQSTSSSGVYGSSPLIGVRGYSAAGIAVRGESTAGTGLSGASSTGAAVSGLSNTGAGVSGDSASGVGVKGTSASGVAVQAISDDNIGLSANSKNNMAIMATSDLEDAIYASSTGGNGINASSTNATGVFAQGGYLGAEFRNRVFPTNYVRLGSQASALEVNGTADISSKLTTGSLEVAGATTVNNKVTANSLEIAGAATVNNKVSAGSLEVTGTATINGKLTANSVGTFVRRTAGSTTINAGGTGTSAISCLSGEIVLSCSYITNISPENYNMGTMNLDSFNQSCSIYAKNTGVSAGTLMTMALCFNPKL